MADLAKLTLSDAICLHELDVAGLDIADRREQFENLKQWFGKVAPEYKAQADAALAKVEAGAKKRGWL